MGLMKTFIRRTPQCGQPVWDDAAVDQRPVLTRSVFWVSVSWTFSITNAGALSIAAAGAFMVGAVIFLLAALEAGAAVPFGGATNA